MPVFQLTKFDSSRESRERKVMNVRALRERAAREMDVAFDLADKL